MTTPDAPGALAEASVTANITLPLPVGSVIAYAFDPTKVPPPQGWLLCDGGTFDHATFPQLFAALGSMRLPDLRGYFLRGLDPTGHVDPQGASRAPLSVQEDTFKIHNHSIVQSPFYDNEQSEGDRFRNTSHPTTNSRHDDVTGTSGDIETRPRNVAVNYLIYAGFAPPPQRSAEHDDSEAASAEGPR